MQLIVFITIFFKKCMHHCLLFLPSVNVHCFAKVQDWDVWAWSLWVLPQMWVTQTGLIHSVKCPKFKDMLFLHSWEHVHVRLRSFNCFQMCALASQPFHFCLFPPLSLLSPAGFYLAPCSCLHPLIHILCVISFFYFGGVLEMRLLHSICDMSRNCCVCANVSEPWLDTNTAGNYGMSRVFTVLGQIKLHCKIAFCPLAITDFHSLRQSGLMHVTRHMHQSQTWLNGPVSPLRP